MKPLLELIVHVWSGQLEQYAWLAMHQMTSLYLFPPERCRVQYTVCCCPEDEATVKLLDYFEPSLQGDVRLSRYPMKREMLMRRAIGRNEVALLTRASAVYFAGADYTWQEGALDAACAAVLANPGKLVWPRQIMAQKSQALGDTYIETARNMGLCWAGINRLDFAARKMRKAIGCLQMVSGDVARARGYMPDSRRYQRPADRWRRTHEDTHYRKSFGKDLFAAEIPNIYRLRHSIQGRFVNEKGESP